MKITYFILLFFVCSIAGKAQQEFTLQQCIETALKNNIRLKQSQLSLASNAIDVKTSKAALLPNVNGSFSENFNFGRNIDPISNTYISNSTQSTNMGVNSTVIVFNGFQLLNNLKLAKVNYNAAISDVAALQNDLALQVAASYLQLMYAEDNLTNAKAQLEVTLSQRSRVEILVKSGKLAESMLYEQDAQKANDEYNVQLAENGIISARLSLIQLMELPANTKYVIQRPNIALPTTEAYDVNIIYEQSLGKRPEVKSAELRKEGALISQKMSMGAFYPRVSLSAGLNTLYSNKFKTYAGMTVIGEKIIGYTKSPFDTVFTTDYRVNYAPVKFGDQLNQNFGKYVTLGVTVPIFNNLKIYGSVQKSRINLMNQELNLLQTKNTLLKSIQQAIADVEAAKAKYESASKSLIAQSNNFSNLELKYNQGFSSYLDYITAKNNKARAEVNLQQAKYDLILKSKIIDFYRGINITL